MISKNVHDTFMHMAAIYIVGNCIVYAVFIALAVVTCLNWNTDKGQLFLQIALAVDGGLNCAAGVIVLLLGGLRLRHLNRITVKSPEVTQKMQKVLKRDVRGRVCG